MTDEELHGYLVDRQGSRRDLNTPALIIDLGALTRNVETMADYVASRGVRLRPHAKTHKSPEIARRQIAAGAIGACCAKLGEAEVLADGGVTGLLITSPIVSAPAIQRLVALNARTGDLACVVDNPANVVALGLACAGGKPMRVIIDVDPGMKRTGVVSPEAAVALLDAIRAEPALVYAGVQFYCGWHQHIHDYAERANAIADRAVYLKTVIAALTDAGGAPGIVTGGGTGTHRIDPGLGVFTELQAGSYVFMDSQYLACDLTGDGSGSPFETSLMIDTRVVSTNVPGMATVDAGIKAFSTDAEPPLVLSGAPEGSRYAFMGDEHGALTWPGVSPPALGDVVTLAAPHCDPTVDLYDTYHVVEGNTLRALWPVAARGRSR